MRTKIVKDTKKTIRKLKRANGFRDEIESREALEDPNADEYLKFVVSGDEDSDDTVLGDEEDEGAPFGDGERQGVAGGSGNDRENSVFADSQNGNRDSTHEDGEERWEDATGQNLAEGVEEEEN